RAAAEAWADDALDAARFIAEGKRLYERQGLNKRPIDLKRDGLMQISRGELRLGIRTAMMALYRSEAVKDYLLAAECARALAIGYSFAGRFDHAVYWADESLDYLKYIGPVGNRRDSVDAVYIAALRIKGDAAMRHG